MEGAPPKLLNGRTVAILLVVAIVLTVAAVIYWTRPVEEAVEAPPADPQPLGYYLARADPVRGQAYFERCSVCHAIAPDRPRTIGPNLYGVMGQPIASRPDFTYSRALRNKGGTWDWESANRFLQSPRAFAPGTRMTFVGVTDPQNRADVMLYLNEQGGSLAVPPDANAGATTRAAPTLSGSAPDPGLTRAFLTGRWATDSCSPPAINFRADGTTNDGTHWALVGDRLIVSRGARREQSVVERLARDRIRLNTRDGPFELTRCPLIPVID